MIQVGMSYATAFWLGAKLPRTSRELQEWSTSEDYIRVDITDYAKLVMWLPAHVRISERKPKKSG